MNLQQERLHCEDVIKIQAQLLRLGAEIGHINRGLQNLQEDLTEVAQDYYGASIQQNKDELNRIGELDPEILQNIQDLKNQEASEENSYFQAFCGKSGAQNIQEYRRLRFWQNDPEIFDDGINIYLDRIETLNQKCSSYENDLDALNVKKSAFHQNFEELSVEEKKLRAVLEISKVDFLVIQAEFGVTKYSIANVK